MKKLPALILLFPLLLLSLASCRTVRQAAGQTACAARTDTVRLYEMHRDSIYLHDSIFTSLVTKGDTTFVTKTVTKYKLRDRWRTDTVYKARTDTLRTTDYAWKEKTVERTPWYDKALMVLMAFLLIALAMKRLKK